MQVKRQAADRSCLNYTRRQLLRGEWLGGLGGGPEIARVKLSLQWRTSPVAYHPVRPASRMLSSRRCSNATSAMLNREPFAEQASDDNRGTFECTLVGLPLQTVDNVRQLHAATASHWWSTVLSGGMAPVTRVP